MGCSVGYIPVYYPSPVTCHELPGIGIARKIIIIYEGKLG